METEIQHIFETLNIEATENQRQQLLTYVDMVLEWNPRVNITGARDLGAFIAGPLFDALTLTAVFQSANSLVDIGSGGGLPAVPLAILFPQVAVTMVEPRKKRAAFLKEVARGLKLNATVIQTQDRELTERDFDAASAQAVFPPKKWINRGKQLVGDGGAIYTLTSESIAEQNLPNRVVMEEEKKFQRDSVIRYVARLRKTKE